MTTKLLGGGPIGLQNAVWDWAWVRSPEGDWTHVWQAWSGLNNIGLLVRVSGKVTEVEPTESPTWFKIDDGSGRAIKCVSDDGSPAIDPLWLGKYAVVTGISSCEMLDGSLVSKIRLKKDCVPAIY